MKKILVPTDFSRNAQHALEYAVCVANHFKATIELMHSYRVRSQSGMFISVEKHIEDDVKVQMERLTKSMKDKLVDEASIIPHIIRDDAAHAITRTADDLDVDMVIMGTQGSSLFREIFVGSVATSVMRQISKPLLVIPHGTKCEEIHRIVLALDALSFSSASIFAPLLKLGEIRDAEILVFHSESYSDEFTGIDPRIETFLQHTPHSYHQETSDKDVNSSLRTFCNEQNADLLCLIHRQKAFLERIFSGSVTQREFFHTSIPMLILRETQ